MSYVALGKIRHLCSNSSWIIKRLLKFLTTLTAIGDALDVFGRRMGQPFHLTSSRGFLLLPLEYWKYNTSHHHIPHRDSPITTGKYIQPIRIKEKVRNIFWLTRDYVEDIREWKMERRRRLVSTPATFQRKKGQSAFRPDCFRTSKAF